jgi:inner membrane protein
MDTLTHALSGAVIARLIAARQPAMAPGTAPTAGTFSAPWSNGAGAPRTWQYVMVGMLAGAFPDIDFVARYVSDLAYLRHHRGITHSLLMWPLWSLLLAWLLSFAFAATRGVQGGWKSLYVVVAAAIAIHIAGDWITQFGTMLLEPLSDARFGLGATFIIDLTLSGLLLAGLVLAALFPRRRWPSAAALAAVVAWVGVSWIGKQEAITAGEAYARAQGFPGAEVDAIPRPASPFNWTVTVREGDRFHVAHLNTRRVEPLLVTPEDHFIRRLSAPYQPVGTVAWSALPKFGTGEDEAVARAVWQRPEFGFFRWFAQVPVLDRVERRTLATGGDQQCAWFRDLRFGFPGRTSAPFRYGLCLSGPLDAPTAVAVYKLDDNSTDAERVAAAAPPATGAQ